MGRIGFGVLMFPIHRPAHNPTLQLESDLELAALCDRLGFDEFWFGEHHSGGWQIIGAPELMIAAAAQRTSHIRLGAGVSTLSRLAAHERALAHDGLTRRTMAAAQAKAGVEHSRERAAPRVPRQRAAPHEAVETDQT